MASGAAAHADTTMISQDNFGILNGTQVFAPIQAPINLCGIAAAVGGEAFAGCEGGSAASINGLYDATMISQGNFGLLNGTQVLAPIQAPIDVCGVAVAVLGQAFAGCEGGASATLGDHGKGHKGNHRYEESESVPEGCGTTCPPTQTAPPAHQEPQQPPAGENPNDCPPSHHRGHGDHGDHGAKGKHGKHFKHDNDDVTMISAGNFGALNGTQVFAPIQVPIDVSGVAAGVLGMASAWSVGGSSAHM